MSPRPLKFRFYLDENFPTRIGKFLGSIGHNVKYVVTNKTLRAKSDLWHLKQAIREKRIILGSDQDFKNFRLLLDLVVKSPGVIDIRTSDLSSKKIERILNRLLKKLTESRITGRICIASIDKISYINPEKIKDK